jgi:ring-1,2-phenylacetyl-CoA epoxidase subunit PaaE
MSTDKTNIAIKKVVRETTDSVTIYFEGSQFPFDYESGQYLTLIDTIDGEEVRRPYSLCTAPGVDEDPGVTVKRVNQGKMSNHLNDKGETLEAMDLLAPIGNFKYLPDESGDRPVVLIGGGSGVTPLLSILKTALNKTNALVYLVYANSNKGTSIFYDTLEKLSAENDRLTLVHFFSDDHKVVVEKPKGLRGLFKRTPKVDPNAHRLTAPRLSEILQKFAIKDANTFICGPEGLMQTAESTLKVNFSGWTLNQEKFFSTKEADLQSTVQEGAHKVLVKLNGELHEFQVDGSKSILLAGLDEGIDMPFSCQSGLCTACMGKCTSGTVEMTENSGLSDDEVAEGYILTCTGHPKSDVVVEID